MSRRTERADEAVISGNSHSLSPWRWLRRATGYGPLVGGFSAAATVPTWIPLVVIFGLVVAVLFGLACRVWIGSEPAGGGLAILAGGVPFVLLNAMVRLLGPVQDGLFVRVFVLSVLCAVSCAAITAVLARQDRRPL